MSSSPEVTHSLTGAVADVLSSILGKPVTDPSARLAEDLGLDSLQFLELIARIDERFDVDLGLQLAEGVRLYTVDAVVRAVDRGRGDATGDEGQDAPTERAPVRGEVMHPFFFEHGTARLYGVLHPAPQTAMGDVGVVLCNPFAHEYYQTQRALRHVGLALAAEGLPALRYDLRGTGNSSDDLHEARLADWVASVPVAAEALRQRTGVARVALVGLRLGATLAARAAAHVTGLADLVLWNPIANGAAYVESLERTHRRAFGRASLRRRADGELLGARVHADLLEEIAATSWSDDATHLSAARGLLLRGSREPETDVLEERLRAAGFASAVQPDDWSWDAFYSSIYWPQQSLKRIVEHLSGA